MSDLGSMSLGVKLGIVLGSLIALTFAAGGLKLYINKRRVQKNLKTAQVEAAKKTTDREKLVQRQGDLEHGYFNGVAQSRPHSPSPSYILAPETPIIDWAKSGNGSLTPSGSLKNFPRSRNTSITSFPTTPNSVRMKPSSLRLQPSDAEINRARNSPSAIGGMGGAYMPPPPSPRADRSASPMFGEQKPAGWVSPLDVHFSKPITPQPYRPTSYLPKLNFPWESGSTGLLMPVSNDIKSEAASIVNSKVTISSPAVLETPPVKTPKLSTFPQEQKTNEPWRIPEQLKIAQQQTILHEQKVSENQKILSHAGRDSSRTIFPSDDLERRASIRSPTGSRFDIPPVPLEDLPPPITSIDPNVFPHDSRQWNPATSPTNPRDSIMQRKWAPSPAVRDRDLNKHWDSPSISESIMKDSWDPSSPTIPDSVLDAQWEASTFSKPVIRDSIVSKKRVSVTRPPLAAQDMSNTSRNRIQSIAASSMYSMENYRYDEEAREDTVARHERMRSQVASIQSYSQNPSRSGSRKQSSPASGSLSRIRDSFHRHSRNFSEESLITTTRRGGRDQDFEEQNRNRSRSVVDSDHPRESPFSNSNATSDHSSSSSISSYISTKGTPVVSPIPTSIARNESTSANLEQEVHPDLGERNHIGGLEVSIPDSARLSVTPGRGRSGSEVSRTSIGSFYDSYFRNSTMGGQQGATIGGRNSVASQIRGFNARDSGVLSSGDGNRIPMRDPKRPAPLNFKLGQGTKGTTMTGGKYGGHETIVELPTPLPTPLNGTGAFGPDRYHTRI